MIISIGDGNMFVGTLIHEERVGFCVIPATDSQKPGTHSSEYVGEISDENYSRDDALYFYIDSLDSLNVLELHLAKAKEVLLDKKLSKLIIDK